MAPRSSSRSPVPQRDEGTADRGERLQKVLAAAGVASRRECEGLITAGRVRVNGRAVTELGVRVQPERDEIEVDGETLARQRLRYFIVNKPPGVVCTNRDPDGRPRVIDLVPEEGRFFTVGRLDQASEGLILVTNDGELANRLAHPRYGVPKTYRVRVVGRPTQGQMEQLRKGVHTADGVMRVHSIRQRGRWKRGAELEIVLTEGKNREIRRMLARLEHKVVALKRIALGPLRLSDLPRGECRPLTSAEVAQLKRTASRQPSGASRVAKGSGPDRAAGSEPAKRRRPGTPEPGGSRPRKPSDRKPPRHRHG